MPAGVIVDIGEVDWPVGGENRDDCSGRVLTVSNRRLALALAGLGLFAPGPARGGVDVWTSNLAADSSLLPVGADPVDPMAVYAGTSTNLFKTLDGGASWGIVGSLPAGSPIFSLAIDPTGQTVYAGSREVADVFRSSDGGATWEALSFGGSLGAYPRSLGVDPSNAAIVYAGLARDGSPGGSLLKSSDSGDTWTATIAGLPASGGVPAVLSLAIDPVSPTTVYAGLEGAGVYKSANGGVLWEATGLGSVCTDCTVHGLAIDSTATATLYAATDAGMFRTTDGGVIWRDINGGLRDPGGFVRAIRAVVIDPVRPEVIYAGTADAGVFRSLDRGITWSAWSEGLADQRILSLGIDVTGTQVHAGTPTGVFDRTLAPERLLILPPRNRPAPRLVELPRP
jgi:hypothetical protein